MSLQFHNCDNFSDNLFSEKKKKKKERRFFSGTKYWEKPVHFIYVINFFKDD